MGLREVLEALEIATRQGAEQDAPEGSRYAVFSDTLLSLMADAVRHAIEERQ